MQLPSVSGCENGREVTFSLRFAAVVSAFRGLPGGLQAACASQLGQRAVAVRRSLCSLLTEWLRTDGHHRAPYRSVTC